MVGKVDEDGGTKTQSRLPGCLYNSIICYIPRLPGVVATEPPTSLCPTVCACTCPTVGDPASQIGRLLCRVREILALEILHIHLPPILSPLCLVPAFPLLHPLDPSSHILIPLR
jgi:hypothetical protein